MIMLAGNADVVSTIGDQSASDLDVYVLPLPPTPCPAGLSPGVPLASWPRPVRRESRIDGAHNASSIGHRRVEVSVPSTEGQPAGVWDLIGG